MMKDGGAERQTKPKAAPKVTSHCALPGDEPLQEDLTDARYPDCFSFQCDEVYEQDLMGSVDDVDDDDVLAAVHQGVSSVDGQPSIRKVVAAAAVQNGCHDMDDDQVTFKEVVDTHMVEIGTSSIVGNVDVQASA